MKFYALIAAVWFTVAYTDAKAAIIYDDRTLFEASIDNAITDDYQRPEYQLGDVRDDFILDRHTDARVSSIFGETTYRTTYVSNINAIALYRRLENDGTPSTDRFYCGGCNASFELGFGVTSIDVDSVGIDIGSNYSFAPFWASVLFGDGSRVDYLLPLEERARITHTFWGVKSDLGIEGIHFGAPGGRSMIGGSFAIDNLTIGGDKRVIGIPTPAAIWLLSTGLGLLFVLNRKEDFS